MSKNVLLVDGYSTGRFYFEALMKRGYPIYHLATKQSEKADKIIEEIKAGTKELLKKCKKCFMYNEDFEQTIAELKKYDFCCVIPGTESGVILAAQIAKRLSLPYNGGNNMDALRNKFEMQRMLKENNVNYIKSQKIYNVKQALAFYHDNHDKPIVIKYTQSSASNGIFICENESDIKLAIRNLKKPDIYGHTDSYCLAQEYINGTEYIVNCVSHDSKHIITDIWKYTKVQVNKHPVYDKVILMEGSQDTIDTFKNYVCSVLDALQIKRGPSHNEIKITEDGRIFLIEVGVRPCGGDLYLPDCITKALPYNPMDWAIDSYVDEQAFLEHKDTYTLIGQYIVKFLISRENRKITKLPNAKIFEQLDSVVHTNLQPLESQMEFKITKDLDTKPGVLYLVNKDNHQLLKDLTFIEAIEANHFKELFKSCHSL